MKVLVCGGRDFKNEKLLEETLSEYKIDFIIDGGAMGADYLAYAYAVMHNIKHESFPAEWKEFGKAAGPIRNKQMLDEGKPDLVIAFPGGRGTANMVEQAEKAGVKVIRIEDE